MQASGLDEHPGTAQRRLVSQIVSTPSFTGWTVAVVRRPPRATYPTATHCRVGPATKSNDEIEPITSSVTWLPSTR